MSPGNVPDSPDTRRRAGTYWRDVWQHRDLALMFAWREIAARHKQTLIGIAWVLLRPFLTMVVFTVVFEKLAKLPSDNAPYPLLVFAALLPWQFVASALTEAGNSLVGNAHIITKIYFPRLVFPASAVLISLVDFFVSLVLLALLMFWYGFMPGWQILALPLFMLLAVGIAFGAGIWIAALHVRYRDFRYLVPFMLQIGLYISPVGFSSTIVPHDWRFIYSLNPMVGVIDGFRWTILDGHPSLYWPGLALSSALTAFLLVTGIRNFRNAERTLADTI